MLDILLKVIWHISGAAVMIAMKTIMGDVSVLAWPLLCTGVSDRLANTVLRC